MKRTIILILLVIGILKASAQAPNCINLGSASSWHGFYTQQTTIQDDKTHGTYVQIGDDDGPSYVVNDAAFGGNWITMANGNTCLCYDYNVTWNTSIPTVPVTVPHFAIYTGATATLNYGDMLNRVRAAFIGNNSNPAIQNGLWATCCLPIGLCVNGQLPSNSYGSWQIYDIASNAPMTGAAASAAWDNLIQHVTGAYFGTDYNSSPSEVIKYANLCFSCKTNTCACSSFVQFTQAPFAITPDGTKISAPSCDHSFGSVLSLYTNYQFSAGFQTYNSGSCATTYTAVITDANNNIIASQNGGNTPAPFSQSFTHAGNYCITYSLKVNGTVCATCKACFTVSAATQCCNNTFPFWTDIPVPASYPFANGTYSVEDFVVHGANSIPITEIKVTVEDFELISKYQDCLKCYNQPATLGSIFGGSTIGAGSNKLSIQVQPYGNGNIITNNSNEVIWENPNGVTLGAGDKIRLVYILPAESEIPCCVDSAKICVRFSYRDINCGYCEVYNCTVVPLRPKGANTTLPTLQLLFYNARGIFQPGKAPGF
ncbi:MAG: hypothetical protein ACHQHN_17945 [Sphingobacteriales bacterium]